MAQCMSLLDTPNICAYDAIYASYWHTHTQTQTDKSERERERAVEAYIAKHLKQAALVTILTAKFNNSTT